MDMRDEIKSALERKKLSRRGAARLANMKASSLCAYLKGNRELRTDTLARLMEATGLSKGKAKCEPAPPANQSPSASNSKSP